MPNLVEVTIRVNDATGPAFASVLTRAEALKAALADAGTVRLGVNISGLDSSLIALRAKMQSLGIADIADVNVQPGKITAQLQLLKRLITQQGISDLLDVNLNQGQLDEELARLKSLNETIPVKLDVSDPDVVKTLAAETIPVKFDVPENIPGLGSSENISEKFTISGLQDAEQQLAALNSALKDSDDEFLKLADDGKLTEQSMEALTSQFEGLYRQMEFVKGEYADISQELANGSGPGDAAAEIDLLNGMLKDLSGNINAAGQDISGHAEAFEALSNFAAASGKDVNDLGASLDALGAASAAAQSRLTNVTLGAQGLETAAAEVSSAVDDTSDHISKVSIVSGSWFKTLTNIGSTGIPLFSGALGELIPALEDTDSGIVKLAGHLVNTTNGWHLMTEAVVETVAIWGPATIAAVAFGAAAYPAVMKITQQLTNMNTAAKGTGQAFQSLASSGESVTAAVKPSVLEAFGIGLDAIHTSSGELAPDLAKLGSAFDQLAAKAAAAFESSTGGNFMAQASDDLLKLIDSFSAVGSILGTLMKAVPGYAEVLLNFGDAGLHAGADVVAGIEPVLAAFLKLHGAILYGGLTGTASAWVFAKIVDAASGAALGVATAASSILGEENIITKGALGLGGAIEDLSAGPIIAGVGLLAGAFAAVVLYLKASKSQADDFNSSIQGLISSSTLAQLHTTIAGAMTQTSAQYTAALAKMQSAEVALHGPASTNVADAEKLASQARGAGNALETAAEATGAYKAGLTQIGTQQSNFNANLAEVAKTLGVSMPSALAVLEGAQVTSAQATSKSASNTQQLNIEAQGYLTTLGVMTAGTGSLNQALNALNVTQSTQVTDAQKLTQAYSGWIGIVTSGDSTFASFETSLGTLTAEMTAGSAAGVKYTSSSGKLTEQQKLLGTSLQGTSTSALAARQAFDSQITSAVTLYGNLQTMAAASGNTATAQEALTKAGKDLVAQLLPLANGSQAATAEVYALAQIAGYSGVDSFTSLSKWLGTTKGAESDLNNQTTILTISTANLTAAAKNLSTAVGTEITDAEAAAIAKTQNFQQDTLNLADAINKSQGAASASVVTYAGDFYQSLIKAGTGATTAKQQVDAFLTQLGATPATINTVNAALAKLNPSVTDTGTQAQAAATKIDGNFIKSLQDIMIDAPDVNKYVSAFSSAILASGNSSTQTAAARAALISDLKKAGATATTAKTFVDNLQASIDALKGKTVPVGVQGSGSGTITITGVVNSGDTQEADINGRMVFAAAGGPITGPGGPTQDNIPVWASNGEFMMQESAVRKYGTGFMSMINAGKFATGGLIDFSQMTTFAAGRESPWSGNAESTWGKASSAALAAAVKAAAAEAAAKAAAISSAGVSNASAEAALQSAAAKMGWTGALWTDLFDVEMAEAGFSLTATNPSSGAYGMAQFINGASEYAQYGGNSTTAAGQATAMVNYIAQRYGNPAAAWAHEEADHWYANGGATSAGWASVGERGREFVKLPGGAHVYPAGQSAQMAASAGPVNVSFELGSSGNATFDDFMLTWVREKARIKGGGNVQTAFGRNK